jgi:RNA polymerase sigma-70 factor (ECF subfamily)
MRAVPPEAVPLEHEWITRARAGDRAAFDQIVRLHFQAVNSFLLRIANQREDAEDLAQETFVRAHASLAEFRGDARFSTWLLRIAWHLARDEKRRTSRRGRMLGLDSAAESVDRAPAPHETSAQREITERIRAAVQELPLRLRAALVLRSIEGREYDEIARIVGARPATVRTQVMQARRELARRLGPLLEGDPA